MDTNSINEAVAVLNSLHDKGIVSLYKGATGFDYRVHIAGATSLADVIASADAQRARMALGVLFDGEQVQCREGFRPTGGYHWIAKLQWEQAQALLTAGVEVPHKEHILALFAAASTEKP